MKSTADVVVVGGGVVGTSTTYYLARKGVDVLLVEARDLAAGTSGACDQAIMLQSKNPGLPLKMALASAAIYRGLEAELAADMEYHQDGGMIVIETENEWTVMEEIAAQQRAAGIAVRLLDRREARERQPALSPHILGATHWEGDASVSPLQVCLAFARAARALGAELRMGTRVTGFLRQGDRVTGVQTDRGEVGAGRVLLATGVWTAAVGRQVGLAIPIVPRRGQLLVTEALPPLIRGDILSAAYIAAKHHPELAQADSVAARLGVGLSLTQTRNGNLLIGATREFVGLDRRTTPEGIRAIAANAVRLVPALGMVRVIRTFAGLRPYSPDGLPLLGPARPGLYVAAGHEGDGIALAPFTGRLMADILTDTDPGWDLGPFRPERFGEPPGDAAFH